MPSVLARRTLVSVGEGSRGFPMPDRALGFNGRAPAFQSAGALALCARFCGLESTAFLAVFLGFLLSENSFANSSLRLPICFPYILVTQMNEPSVNKVPLRL